MNLLAQVITPILLLNSKHPKNIPATPKDCVEDVAANCMSEIITCATVLIIPGWVNFLKSKMLSSRILTASVSCSALRGVTPQMLNVLIHVVCLAWTTSLSWTSHSAWLTRDACPHILMTEFAWLKTPMPCRSEFHAFFTFRMIEYLTMFCSISNWMIYQVKFLVIGG